MRYFFLAFTIIFGFIGLVFISAGQGNTQMTAAGAMSIIIAITMRWLGGEKEVVV